MNIAIVVCDLTTGGAERVASLWAKGFDDIGNNVTAILNNRNSPIIFSVPPSVKVVNIYNPICGKLISNLFYFTRLIKLRKLVKEIKPDALITVLHPMGLITKIATIGLGIPIINSEHNAFEKPSYVKFPWYSKFNKFKVNKLFNAVTVLTEADRKIIGNSLKNVFVMPNPVTYDVVDTVPPKKKVILAAGRLSVWYCKGFDLLIKAFNQLSNEYPEWELHIAGNGCELIKDGLTETLSTEIKDRIKFLGYVEDMRSLYRNASIFVLSSRYEGFGMVLVEAMSQGCACVACDYKGRQNDILVDNKYGLLAKTDDIESISEELKALLHNENLLTHYQKAAIFRARDYSLVNIINKWTLLLQVTSKNWFSNDF